MAPPDADIYPEATGPAIDIVKGSRTSSKPPPFPPKKTPSHKTTTLANPPPPAHQSPTPLTLYAGWFCPFVQRVWLVLEEKRIPYTYVEVNPYHKPASLLSLNPRGLVPTLSVTSNNQSKPLYESTVVTDYLEEAYPEHGPRLHPQEPYEKARQRIWIDYVTSRIIPAYHRFLQFQTSDGGEEGLERVRGEYLGALREWVKEADPEGPFFGGKEVGMVDLSFAPWVVSLFRFSFSQLFGFSVLLTVFWCFGTDPQLGV